MRLQIQRLWIQTMQENTIAHIIVGTGRTVFIRKYFFFPANAFSSSDNPNRVSAEYS